MRWGVTVVQALFDALKQTYGYLTPDLWKVRDFTKSPFQEWSDFLAGAKETTLAAPS